MRSLIDHHKVLVLALNGPALGGGATWMPGVADLVFAAENAWFESPFSRLGLVPEFGSATTLAHHIGVHRSNQFLMFGKRTTAETMMQHGLVNKLFPSEDFLPRVVRFLEEQLSINDGGSLLEAKRLQNLPLRKDRVLAVFDSLNALSERVAEGLYEKRFQDQSRKMARKYSLRLSSLSFQALTSLGTEKVFPKSKL